MQLSYAPRSSGPLWRKIEAAARAKAAPAAPRPVIEPAKPKPIALDRALVERIQLALDSEHDKPRRAPYGTGARLLFEVCEKHDFNEIDVRSHRRSHFVVLARQEWFYRMATETTWSLPQIGRWLGGFDHTTVLHGMFQHAKRTGLPIGNRSQWKGRPASSSGPKYGTSLLAEV